MLTCSICLGPITIYNWMLVHTHISMLNCELIFFCKCWSCMNPFLKLTSTKQWEYSFWLNKTIDWAITNQMLYPTAPRQSLLFCQSWWVVDTNHHTKMLSTCISLIKLFTKEQSYTLHWEGVFGSPDQC